MRVFIYPIDCSEMDLLDFLFIRINFPHNRLCYKWRTETVVAAVARVPLDTTHNQIGKYYLVIEECSIVDIIMQCDDGLIDTFTRVTADDPPKIGEKKKPKISLFCYFVLISL